MRTHELPGQLQVGQVGTWIIPAYNLDGVMSEVRVDGQYLGWATSQQRHHRNHPSEHADRGHPCSACRWSEFRLFRQSTQPRWYLLHFTGRSCVPGETTRYRDERVFTAPEVVTTLVTRKRDAVTDTMHYFLTVPAERLLAQASDRDEGIKDALYEWRSAHR